MAKAKLTKNEIYGELEQDIIDFFKERLSNFTLPVDLKFYFQSNKNLKSLIKMTKIPDQYSVIMNKDILVQINPDYFDSFNSGIVQDDDNDIVENETNTILFDQCIDLLSVNTDNGTFKIGKTNFQASKGIIEQYTYDKVQRAIEVQSLYGEQKADDSE